MKYISRLSGFLKKNEKTFIEKDYTHIIICHGVNFISPILDLTAESVNKSLRVNFISAFILAQFFAKLWNKNTTGVKKDRSAVYISSVAVIGGSPDELAYHAAKRASEAAWLSFARWGAPLKIRFNIISPGLMKGPMGEKVIRTRPSVLERIPLRHLVHPEKVAEAIKLMLENQDITGEKLNINCGRMMDI